MEREAFFSGYCRCLDESRMVAVVAQEDRLEEADCNFPHCIYAPNCVIAKEIQSFLETQ